MSAIATRQTEECCPRLARRLLLLLLMLPSLREGGAREAAASALFPVPRQKTGWAMMSGTATAAAAAAPPLAPDRQESRSRAVERERGAHGGATPGPEQGSAFVGFVAVVVVGVGFGVGVCVLPAEGAHEIPKQKPPATRQQVYPATQMQTSAVVVMIKSPGRRKFCLASVVVVVLHN